MQGLEGSRSRRRVREEPGCGTNAFIDFLTQVPQAETWVKDSVKISPIARRRERRDGKREPDEDRPGADRWQHGVVSVPRAHPAQDCRRGRIWMGSVGVLTGDLTAESWMESVEAAAESEPPVIER